MLGYDPANPSLRRLEERIEIAEEHLRDQGFSDRQVDMIIAERRKNGYLAGDMIIDADPDQDYD